MRSLVIILLSTVSFWVGAQECISYGEHGYKIAFPSGMNNFTIDGDSIAYCAKFNVSPEVFQAWLSKCDIELEPLHHGGDIKEILLPNGIITIIKKDSGDEAFIEIINSLDEKVFKEHIGIHRGCTL